MTALRSLKEVINTMPDGKGGIDNESHHFTQEDKNHLTIHQTGIETIFEPIGTDEKEAYWRRLYTIGDRVGAIFSNICDINPDIINMFGCDSKFSINISDQRRKRN